MALSTAIAIYFLIWWLTLFAVLPWGVAAQGEVGTPGTDPGAPRVHNVARKLIWTTIVATVIFAAVTYVYVYRVISLDDLAALMGFPTEPKK
jgi:predicted secreted protein